MKKYGVLLIVLTTFLVSMACDSPKSRFRLISSRTISIQDFNKKVHNLALDNPEPEPFNRHKTRSAESLDFKLATQGRLSGRILRASKKRSS